MTFHFFYSFLAGFMPVALVAPYLAADVVRPSRYVDSSEASRRKRALTAISLLVSLVAGGVSTCCGYALATFGIYTTAMYAVFALVALAAAAVFCVGYSWYASRFYKGSGWL